MTRHLREFIADVLMALLCGCIIGGTIIGTEIFLNVLATVWR